MQGSAGKLVKKPERVEVGQWWRSRFGGQAPERVTPDTVAALRALQSELAHWIDAREYLGSGAHPEPSEWMIETLAEHRWTTKWINRTWSSADADERDTTIGLVTSLLNHGTALYCEDRAVISLYRILRSLGKW